MYANVLISSTDGTMCVHYLCFSYETFYDLLGPHIYGPNSLSFYVCIPMYAIGLLLVSSDNNEAMNSLLETINVVFISMLLCSWCH